MALSDLIKKIEDKLEEWPRSAKIVAGGSVGIGVAAAAFALYTLMNQPRYEPEPAQVNNIVMERNSNTQNFQVPAAPQPVPSPVPTSAQVPTPTSTPTSPSTSTPVPSPTPKPTKTSIETSAPSPTVVTKPAVTPTPEANDYYVVINKGDPNNNAGLMTYYNKESPGMSNYFREEDFFLNYLAKESVITPEQKNDYFNGEDVVIPMSSIANAVYKLFETDRYNANKLDIDSPSILLDYADKELLDPSNYGIPSEDGGYVVINGNNVQTVMVDEHGNTTSVDVEIAGIDEVLDYWLSQNKITVEQRDQYGQTSQLELSFKDGADLFDFAYFSDGGFSAGIDQEGVDIVRDKILPFFIND